jgi:predicted metal-dependent peptidase|tara:strand:+ start:32 stop:1234 length:1203 start_codon:yes stop_codon:yes gene_type:complete
MSDFDLNDHIFRLLQREPFFAALSRRIDKKEDISIKTAGVRINPDTASFEMRYNPEFMSSLDDNQKSGVLIHEFYHLVFEHVLGRLPDELEGAMTNPTKEQAAKFRLWNVAADLSINQLIPRNMLPEKCCVPGEGMFEDIPLDKTAEWYYEAIKQKAEEEGEDGDGGYGEGQFDDHGGWGSDELDSAAKEIAKERLKEAMRKSMNEANAANSWGSVSSDIRKQIADRLTSQLDWRKILRFFVQTSQRSNKKSTPRRLNRRYPYVHPGRRVQRQAQIAISIDQSGSVSDQMLALFYAELNKLSDIATFTVIPFDTKVLPDKVFVWKKGETKKYDRVLSGGTDFDAPTDYVNENGFDGHIVLTDLCAPKPKPSKCPRMWMTDKANASRPYFKTSERIVIIDK